MSVLRPVGIETEYGVLEPGNPYANSIAMSHHLVGAYAADGAGRGTGARAVRWDYGGEDPLNDARGHRIDRAAAHPSQLTDDPGRAAPSGDGRVGGGAEETGRFGGGPAGLVTGGRAASVRRPSAAEELRPSAASIVLTNGARLYVDHAHPEYSGPECLTPTEVVRWDRAGDAVLASAMALLDATPGAGEVVVYKNNVDGKGSAYGTHENYLLDRAVPFTDVVDLLTPFFVTRPIVCGAGRVGLGQRSEEPGFQISQRADYVENEVGLETTFNRPIVNTRDEPHADEDRFRRLHVIGGDANSFDVSTYLKVGTTSLVLWLLERTRDPDEALAGAARAAVGRLAALRLDDPVAATATVSRDLTLTAPLPLRDGGEASALEIQRAYLEAVRDLEDVAAPVTGEPIDAETAAVLTRWGGVLDGLATDPALVASQVEWVAKHQLLDRLREREGGRWDAPRVLATDLQWHDLRPARSIVARLDAAGRIERLSTPAEVAQAERRPPRSTRAYLRGEAIRRYPDAVAAAGWGSLLLDLPGRPDLVLVPMLDPRKGAAAALEPLLDASPDASDLLAALTGGG